MIAGDRSEFVSHLDIDVVTRPWTRLIPFARTES